MSEIENLFINFDKNKYDLYGENKKIYNISKKNCALNTIKDSYKGFTFDDKRSKCLRYNSQELDNNIFDNNINKNIKTYFKTKNTIDFDNLEDQLDNSNYFTPILNDKYKLKELIDEENVLNEKECMNRCINNNENKCNSIIYIDNPTLCTLYKNIKMKNNKYKNKDINDDIYTIKKNISKDKILNEYSLNNEILEIKKENNKNNEIIEDKDDIPLYNCSGLYSTNPFCTQEYDKNKKIINDNNYTDCFKKVKFNNIQNENNFYDVNCKKKFGQEYIYDNDLFNLNSKINCDNDNIKIKCKINFNNDILNYIDKKNIPIEHFLNEHLSNKIKNIDINYLNIIYLFILLIIILLIIIFYIYY